MSAELKIGAEAKISTPMVDKKINVHVAEKKIEATPKKDEKKPAEKKTEPKKEGAQEHRGAGAEKKTDTKIEAEAGAQKTETPKPAEARPAPARPTNKRVVANIYSSFNNTIITVTDQTGCETITTASGGMVVRSGRDKPSRYAATQLANIIADDLKNKGLYEVDLRIRAPGGTMARAPGPGAQAVVRALTRAGIRINRIEETTPIPHGNMKPKGGKRGRRV